MVKINDQPEYKNTGRQDHLQQSTFKSGTIQKHHLLLQSFSLYPISIRKKYLFKPEQPEYNF